MAFFSKAETAEMLAGSWVCTSDHLVTSFSSSKTSLPVRIKVMMKSRETKM